MSSQDHTLFHLLDQLTSVSHGCRTTTLRKGSKRKSQPQFALLMGLVEFKDSFPVAQTVKNLTAMRETKVPSLGLEDPLEKEIAIHSSILAWRIQ